MKKVLFIDRDGTLIWEPPTDFQIDSFEKLKFIPGVFFWLAKIVREADYELVMVTNQDGMGTESFPEKSFWPVQNFLIDSLKSEGIAFSEICIDTSFESEKKLTRKPNTGMLTKYLNGEYDLANSFVIGDRLTDVKLAINLGAKSILIRNYDDPAGWEEKITAVVSNWEEIYEQVVLQQRKIVWKRTTNETSVEIKLDIDGSGKSAVRTGLSFFDHMLDQLARHGGVDLDIMVAGDLQVDEHHTIEDTGIALGEAFLKALGDKRGIERYGFLLPMDDSLAQVALDFGGRSQLEWDANFRREKIGDVPTEMFKHFFKSFCDGARCNLNISAEGENEHHKIESIFKAWARSIRMAVKRDKNNLQLPSTKGKI